MLIRWIAHYRDGNTYTSDWDARDKFKDIKNSNISSLQLQTEKGKLYTLSTKKQKNTIFLQNDTYIKDVLFSRSILRKIAKNTWLKLELDINDKTNINVVSLGVN